VGAASRRGVTVPPCTTDFLFWLDPIAFHSSIRRAAVKSNCEFALKKASSSFLSMVLGQVLPF